MVTECVLHKGSDLQIAGDNASEVKMCIHNLVSIKSTFPVVKFMIQAP